MRAGGGCAGGGAVPCQNRRVDIREVARTAGVSMATASRALNDRAEVSPATRQRVLEVADRLGYQPNMSARTLVRRRSDTVGLLWDSAPIRRGRSQRFLQDLLVSTKIALDEAGLHLMLLSLREGSRDAVARQARAHSLDGLILMGVDPRTAAIEPLIESGVPTVAFDLELRGPAASWVRSDNRAAGASAVDHLADLGHRRIAMIAGPTTMLPARDRLNGFLDRMRERGLEVPNEYVVEGDFFQDSGAAAMRRLLALPDRPTAVFAASDEMAIAAMGVALDAGLRIPQDVSLVGVDDLESASLVRPSLTTLAQDHWALGRALVRSLTVIIERRRTDPGGELPGELPIRLPTHLVIRESTGPASR